VVYAARRPVLLIADERARTEVWRALSEGEKEELRREHPESGEAALCVGCDRDVDGDGVQDIPWGDEEGGPVEVVAGWRQRFRVVAGEGSSAWLRELVARKVGVEVETVPWMPSPALGWRQAGEVRVGVVPEVELGTGQLELEGRDVELVAPAGAVELVRVYGSGAWVWGAFGWGWDVDLPRLRVGRDGKVELFRGGWRWVFSQEGPGAEASVLTAAGVPYELRAKRDGGWWLREPEGSWWEFDGHGLPVVYRDRRRRSEREGWEVRYSWSASGQLLQVEQVNGLGTEVAKPRRVVLEWDDEKGVVKAVEDSTGRRWSYSYDAHRRLVGVKVEGVVVSYAGTTQDVQTTYLWENPGDGPVLQRLRLGNRVREERDGEERRVVAVTYREDGRVERLQHGEIGWQVSYPEQRMAEVRGTEVVERVRWDELGRLVEHQRGEGAMAAVTRYRYGAGPDPLPVAVDLPTAGTDELTLVWWGQAHPQAPRRMWFALERQVRHPDGEGESEPAVGDLVARYEYAPGTNLVTLVELPGGRVWRLERNAQGDVVRLVDPEGRMVEYQRDVLGRLTKELPAGQEAFATAYFYDDTETGCGQLSLVRAPAGQVYGGGSFLETRYRWDARGHLLELSAPGSGPWRSVRHFRVNQLGWELERWVDGVEGGLLPGVGAAQRLRRVYDRGGLVKELYQGEDTLGITVSLERTEAGLVSRQVRQALGGLAPAEVLTVQYSYDADGRLRGVSHLETGRAVRVAYDGRGREVRREAWTGQDWVATVKEYGRGDDLPTAVVYPGGHRLVLRYDRLGRLVETADQLGRRKRRVYDLAGRVVEEGLQDSAGAWWRWQSYGYNLADQLTSLRRAYFTVPGSPSQAPQAVWQYTYEPLRGLLQRVEGPQGLVIEVENDLAGRPWQRRVSDGSQLLFTWESAYWPGGEVAEEVEWPAEPGPESPASYRTLRTYDVAGRLLEEVRPGGHGSWYAYDALGRVVWRMEEAEEGLLLREWTHSALGTKVRVTGSGLSERWETRDVDGLLVAYQETGGASFAAVYDGLGRVVEQHLPWGGQRSYTWNEDGTLAQAVLGDGTVLQHTYDPVGRLVRRQVVPPAGGGQGWSLWQTYAYDPLDRVVEARDDLGRRVERVWDSFGGLVRDSLQVGGRSFTSQGEYDLGGGLVRLVYPDGTEMRVSRDALGRRKRVEVNGRQLWRGGYHGLRLGDTVLGVVEVARRHSAEGLPAQVRGWVGGAEVFGLERWYTADWRVAGQQWEGAGLSVRWSLARDGGRRVVKWEEELGELSSLVGVGGLGKVREEAVEQVYGGGVMDDLVRRVVTRRGRGQEEVFQIDGASHQVRQASGWSYSYDGEGNRHLGVGVSGEEVEWRHDWGHRLVAVERQGEGGVRFAYDPLGRRIGEEGSEGKLWRVFFGEQEVARYREEAGVWKLVKRMYWGDGVDELLAYDWDGDGDGEVESRLYAVTDGAGSVQALVDETGKVVEVYRYGPEGRVEVRGVDSTKPEVRMVRARWVGGGQRVEVWFSEGVRVESGVVEVRSSTGQVLAGQRGGLPDGRAVWVELASPLAEGQSYTVHVEGVVDGAGNALAEPVELAFSGPSPGGEVVVPGAEGGGLVAVVDGPEGLVVVAGVPVKGETVAGSLLVRRGGVEVPGVVSLLGEEAGVWQGRVLVWQPEEARAYGVGEYVVSFSPSLADGAGRPLAGPGSVRFVHRGEGDVVWVEAWQVPVRAFSAFGNDHFLHGRPYVASVGLYDHRARFYEARTSTFLEPDPLGPVDSPNLYAAFSFDALSVTDPFGQCQWKDLECWNWVAKDFVLTTGHDLWNVASLGTLTRVEQQRNLGTLAGVGESVFQAARSISNVASFGLQESIYETQMREGAGVASALKGIGKGLVALTPYEETKALLTQWHTTSAPERWRLAFTGISKTAALAALGAWRAQRLSQAVGAGERVAGAAEGATEGAQKALAQEALRAEQAASSSGFARLWGPHNGPGPLGAKMAITFRSATYWEITLPQDTVFYRVYGGAAKPIGQYWTRIRPAGPLQAQLDFALVPSWGNTAESVLAIKVPAGTTVFEGYAAPQPTGFGTLIGGGNQVVIRRVDPAWILPDLPK
jgi:RHS repeat-associated protein